jgi:hypothetical protein
MTRTGISVVMLLAAALLVACSIQGATQVVPVLRETPTRSGSVEQTDKQTVSATSQPADVEVKSVVEGFGKQLQVVSLLSPTVTQDMEKAYAAYVSAALLQTWMNNPSGAPGRAVSSPWPDRIEITSLTQQGSDRYMVSGDVVEISSAEAAGSGEAARTPVQITVEKIAGHWMITGYTGEY